MRQCWSFCDNGTYKVGCNGQTMYLYDAEDRELARFKDINYAYVGAFKPGTNIFVLRSTAGRIAVYDCDERKLLTKFRFSDVDASQDDGFCFSPDGKYFFNIERVRSSTRTRLSIYETDAFTPVRRLFENNLQLVLVEIEYDPSDNGYHVLFFLRGDDGVYSQGYVGVLTEEGLAATALLNRKAYSFLHDYKSLQLCGFTKRKMKWSWMHFTGYSDEEILKLRDRHFTLASFPQIADEVVK